MQELRLKTFILFYLIGFLSIGEVDAQPSSSAFKDISISSPNATALGKYGDYPISYNTGLPQISIPIYTVKEGPLSLPVSLSYHASGLKVMEAASWVGAGWSLNAGGVITRTVVGGPDDRGYLTNTLKGHFSDYGYNSYMFNPAGGSAPPTCYTYPEDNVAIVDDQGFQTGEKDGEPDLFFFNFGSYSGKFYFRDDRTAVLVPEDDLKIDPILDASSLFIGFIIITIDGTKYYFGKNQLSDGNINAIETTASYTAESGSSVGTVNSAWYLNRIVSADSKFAINLIYAVDQYSYFTIAMFPVADGDLSYKHCRLVKNFINGIRLSQINFSNGNITLTPGAIRTDLGDYQNISMFDIVNASSKTLGNISITNNSGLCKKYNFSYSYFEDNTSPLPQALGSTAITTDTKRLKLDFIKEVNCDNSITTTPYIFEYTTSANSFAPRRLTFAQDHWGFYNGKTSNLGLIPGYTVNDFQNYVGADRESSWPEISYGSLNKITYPTGGSTTFVFEGNSVWSNYTYYTENLVKSSDIGPKYNQTQNQSININTSANKYRFVLDFERDVLNNIDAGSASLSGPSIGLIVDKNYPHKEAVITPGAGSKTYTLSQSGMINGTKENAHLSIYEEVPTTYQANKIVGGQRIKSITSQSATAAPIITTYSYESAGQSTGVLYSRPTYIRVLRNDIKQKVGEALSGTCSPNGCFDCDNGLSYRLSPSSLRPMETVQGNHTGYNRVEVSQTGNGKSIYQYYGSDVWDQNHTDVSTRRVSLTSCLLTIPNYPDAPFPFEPLRGQLKYEAHQNQAGNLLKSVYYNPVYDNNPVTTPAYLTSSEGPITLYDLKTFKKTKLTTETYDYSVSGGQLKTVNDVFYESPYHHQPTREVTTSSKGEQIEKKYKYVFDFRVPACEAISNCYNTYNSSYQSALNTFNSTIATCVSGSCNCKWPAFQSYRYKWSVARKNYVACRKSNFMDPTNAFKTAHDNAKSSANGDLKPILEMQDKYINSVIESTVWKNGKLLDAGFSQYGLDGSSNVYINNTKKIDLSQPSAAFTTAAVNGNGLTKDTRYNNESTFKFDKGNIVEQAPRSGGIKKSYIWDHNNSYPVAVAINANFLDIAYTSFEANGNGRWTVNSTSRTTTTSVTGKQCYSLTNGTVTIGGLDNAKRYTISIWARNEPSITNAIKTKSGRSFNGFVYYGFTTNLGATSIVLSGNGLIDELRLYPTDAQMSTYTYDPLIGMSSQCDINNVITFYEYDGLGRLNTVRDADKNILKQYCYNYAGQPVNCASFSNGLQTMTFVKEGCSDPLDYAGSEVADTVLAGTYFSDISQAEADSIAKAYLLVNGQVKANTIGACLPLMSFILNNYEHIADFTIKLTSVRDSSKVYTIAFPQNSDETPSLERVPQGKYDIEITKTDNTQSFLFTVSGAAGEIQLNSDKATWTNVPVYTNLFNRISMGLSQ